MPVAANAPPGFSEWGFVAKSPVATPGNEVGVSSGFSGLEGKLGVWFADESMDEAPGEW